MPTHHTPLHLAAAQAVASRAGVGPQDLKVDAPPRADLGDLAVGCFAIAKALAKAPPEAAREIAQSFEPTPLLASATATGPFVNFRANRPEALRWVVDAALRGTLVPSTYGHGTICIDYSSPNISKHLAYHHIRGTTLGHALVKLNRALGYEVVGINFLGDWGTTHGQLLAAWQRWGPVEPLDIAALNTLYVKFNAAAKESEAVANEGRAWFQRLEAGDPEARALWQQFRDVSWDEFQQVYGILGINFEEVRGESAYEPDLQRVMDELTAKGLVVTSDGAQVVELEGEKTPVLLRKGDGSTLYATRDTAAAEYHWNTYRFTKKLYVVGREQSLHFRQLFKLLAKAGHDWAPRLQHVAYGHIRLHGKKTGSRLGNVVLMRNVFEIVQDEMRGLIAKNNPERAPADIEPIATIVGIGAVVFANLLAQREKDIDFDLEQVTSLEGGSGPYVQYMHARCASVERKAGERVTASDGVDFGLLTHDLEWAVARRLFELPDAVVRAADASEPHTVCHYLLQLAADFSRWYSAGNEDAALRIACPDPALRRARLALTAATRATLAAGLGYLGIAAPDWM
jgi:arginyl-tRNA synthetase